LVAFLIAQTKNVLLSLLGASLVDQIYLSYPNSLSIKSQGIWRCPCLEFSFTPQVRPAPLLKVGVIHGPWVSKMYKAYDDALLPATKT